MNAEMVTFCFVLLQIKYRMCVQWWILGFRLDVDLEAKKKNVSGFKDREKVLKNFIRIRTWLKLLQKNVLFILGFEPYDFNPKKFINLWLLLIM